MINKQGFTLIEVLVATGVIAVIGVVLVVIFTNTLRGNSKSQILSVIKQNGQGVLDNIGANIRGADNVVCPLDGSSSNTMVIIKNGTYTRYRIALPTDARNTAPDTCVYSGKNGCIFQDKPTKVIDEDTGEEETDGVFIPRICSPADLSVVDNSILTDTNVQTGVLINRGSFTVKRLDGFRAIIEVEFALEPGTSAPSVVAGQIDPVTFQTTLQLK
ncbi:hypothetical protein A3J19_01795 [Candidatus Daviesbacteria bacterium RIFCSPLOWO2_02_FULL_41_8]|uniref:Prepilin-type N-terminal cleavage/methylation domain-containing protein n=3 Tax=Candidatus Daviesiibacteriota TaxID=1752718 RepID=A0A1F5NI60_9BACT|nr:MAG: hypothetical protein A2871_00950 [Candidatus Daviesbacteria bacterium RIFCSPHIGHO2_01_FULL_41_23]OGE32958.1 MAG: hypothetical protein A3D83_04815 [Candidatus Daviesbacteria bacterium RIFCSPHIGHO2_02_FULL_41_10]OGE62462.1 MAG: hypothetical protein A2967_01435 [Candidatus Daviesbacteria bacterium RIFCSPLOWO2_01_FULL_41_32]OGE77192.1 MAG: hypothetical protein A3J19_01795 [Candidatus Daviesbacteria bacterium RIFCSPLOWO2_02_FULL_41_8]